MATRQAVHTENAGTLRELAQMSAQCAQLKSAQTESNSFADENRQLRDELSKKTEELGSVKGKIEELRRSENEAYRVMAYMVMARRTRHIELWPA